MTAAREFGTGRALLLGMIERYMNERYLLVFLAALLAGSIGAFFLYVPILPIIGVATTLIGLVAMFLLGFHAGHQQTALATQRYTGRTSFWGLWKHAR